MHAGTWSIETSEITFFKTEYKNTVCSSKSGQILYQIIIMACSTLES